MSAGSASADDLSPLHPVLFFLVSSKKDSSQCAWKKTGEGDSDGPACTDLKATAELEAEGYAAALDALRGYDFVDPKEMFVFAHSLGPLLASLALPGKKVRGVMLDGRARNKACKSYSPRIF